MLTLHNLLLPNGFKLDATTRSRVLRRKSFCVKLKELLERYDTYAKSAVPALSKPQPENFKPRDVWGDFND
jgi:hypothetical protein